MEAPMAATRSVNEHAEAGRTMSMPDMAELSDIVEFDAALISDGDDENDDELLPQQTMRLFSLGLHRSMSMPKQQQPTTNEGGEEQQSDDFFFPDDEEEEREPTQDSFLPKFYSDDMLGSLLPPTEKMVTATDGEQATCSSGERELSGSSVSACASSDETLLSDRIRVEATPAASCDDVQTEKDSSVKQKPSKKLPISQQETALADLSAFFGSNLSSERAVAGDDSPTSVTRFPDITEEEQKGLSSNLKKLRRNSSPDVAETAAVVEVKPESTSPRRTIFEKANNNSEEEDEPQRQFNPLTRKDRTTSMPAKLPSSRLPRKPSLKKVSSFIGKIKEADSADGVKHSVSFSNLEIREYNVTLGDNPSVSFGPPLSLGWDYSEAQVVSLEKYEKARRNKHPRRNSHQLIMSYNVRKYLLLKTAGYSKAELREAMKEVERIKNQRKLTDIFSPIDDAMEGVVDHVKSMFQATS